MDVKLNLSAWTEADINISFIHLIIDRHCQQGWRLEQKEDRPFYGLVYVLAGSAVHQTEAQTQTVGRQDILYLAKGSRYVTTANPGEPYRFIVLSFQVNADACMTDLPIRTITQPVNPLHFQDLFREAAERWQKKDVLYKLKCSGLVGEILYQLVQESIQAHLDLDSLARIRPAVAHMEQHFQAPVSMTELAGLARLSVSHFRRLFRQVYGMAPQEYLRNLRISRAKDLIRSESYSVGEVAERSGFTNIYYFSRVFKQVTGLSPSEFRQF